MVTIAPPGGAYFMAASIVSIMHAVTALLHTLYTYIYKLWTFCRIYNYNLHKTHRRRNQGGQGGHGPSRFHKGRPRWSLAPIDL